MRPIRPAIPLAALLLALLIPAGVASAANTAPTANVQSDAHVGIPETGDGLGTEFHITTGAGDVEDPWNLVLGRWDWEGDGSWDMPWTPLDQVPVHHAYAQPGTFHPTIEVEDTGGLKATSVGAAILVEAPRTLALDGSAATGAMTEDGHRHDYTLVVPERHLDMVVTLDFPFVAGLNLDLYMQPGGSRVDVNSCSPPSCRSSTSLQTGGRESLCLRFVAPGTYSIAVVARSVATGPPSAYTLSARSDAFDATTQTATCLATGPVPIEYAQDVLAHP